MLVHLVVLLGIFLWYNHQVGQNHINIYNDFNRDIANIFYCGRHKDRAFLKELLKYEVQKEELFNQFKSDLMLSIKILS